MPYENLALQLKADNWARTLERLQEEYHALAHIPEEVRPERRRFLDAQIANAKAKLESFAQHGIRPNPPGTTY